MFLKQSTAVDIAFGPFVDSTDGVTAETALTIAQADVRLKKNAAAWAQKNETTSATHEENGWYEIPLDATDTNTLGQLVINVSESGALPVWERFTVVAANVYDSLVGGGDTLDVQVTGIATDAVNAAALAADAVAEINATVDTALTDYDAPTKTEMDAAFAALNDLSAAQVNTEVDTALADYDAPTSAELVSEINSVQADIAALNDPTAAAVADAVWDEARAGHVAAGSFGEGAASVQGNVTGSVGSVTGAVGSVAGNVDGSIGSLATQAKADVNAEADTALTDYDAPTHAELVSEIDDVQTDIAAVSAFVDTEVAAIKAKTDNLPADPADASDIAASFAALNDLSAAQVNAEVVDALATDTYAEPAGVPAATASLKDKVGWLFTLARNKVTQTEDTTTLRNDADGADIATSAVSDDATTFTRGEWS